MEIFIGLSFIVLPIVLGVLWIKARKKYKQCVQEYAGIIDIKLEQKEIEEKVANLKAEYKEKISIYNELKREVALYHEEIELVELGLYKPYFDFDTSERFKQELLDIRQEQKRMLSEKIAIFCNQEWTVEGSKSKGRAMTNRGIRLTSRAFNNECDALISKVTWNNVQKIEERIKKTYEAINKLNESTAIQIDSNYKIKISRIKINL